MCYVDQHFQPDIMFYPRDTVHSISIYVSSLYVYLYMYAQCNICTYELHVAEICGSHLRVHIYIHRQKHIVSSILCICIYIYITCESLKFTTDVQWHLHLLW